MYALLPLISASQQPPVTQHILSQSPLHNFPSNISHPVSTRTSNIVHNAKSAGTAHGKAFSSNTLLPYICQSHSQSLQPQPVKISSPIPSSTPLAPFIRILNTNERIGPYMHISSPLFPRLSCLSCLSSTSSQSARQTTTHQCFRGPIMKETEETLLCKGLHAIFRIRLPENVDRGMEKKGCGF